jgi:glutathione synthase/RimK-type ligase-like ATP-grasp enzyme
VNVRTAAQRADNKIYQLHLAQAVGLTVPRTVVTNDPDQVRALYDAMGGRMIAKTLTSVSASYYGDAPFVYTNLVHEQDLAGLDALRHSPMIFQELIHKAVELRVIFVAGRFFVGQIDVSQSARGQIDWRLANVGEVAWQHDALPGDAHGQVGTGLRRD